MRNWLRTFKQMWTGQRACARRTLRGAALVARKAAVTLEVLEDRTTPSTLDLVGGVLTYSAAAGETNNVSLLDQATTTRVIDSGAAITLGTGASAAGFTLSPDGHTALGPNATVTNINLQLGDMNDIANIQAINHPTMVQGADGNDTTNVSSAASLIGNLAGINANLGIDAGAGVNTLNVSDFTAGSGNSNVNITGSQITGFAGPTDGSTINYAATGGSFGLIRLLGANSPSLAESFTV